MSTHIWNQSSNVTLKFILLVVIGYKGFGEIEDTEY